jgi:hypothetical protein
MRLLGTQWKALIAILLLTACTALAGPIGRRVDIGGRSLHIVCMGEGPHTVVLESGAAVGFYEWWLVQNALRDQIRTCSYDRAGFGWSDPSSQRSVAGYIADLHELLRGVRASRPHAAGVSPGAHDLTIGRDARSVRAGRPHSEAFALMRTLDSGH